VEVNREVWEGRVRGICESIAVNSVPPSAKESILGVCNVR
jgi:hypothetical protein